MQIEWRLVGLLLLSALWGCGSTDPGPVEALGQTSFDPTAARIVLPPTHSLSAAPAARASIARARVHQHEWTRGRAHPLALLRPKVSVTNSEK
jgi:hypothetical protein